MKSITIPKQTLKRLKGNWTIAEIEISYKPIITDHTVITSSYQAYELIKQLWNKDKISLQEQFEALFFNQSKKTIGWSRYFVHSGSGVRTLVGNWDLFLGLIRYERILFQGLSIISTPTILPILFTKKYKFLKN